MAIVAICMSNSLRFIAGNWQTTGIGTTLITVYHVSWGWLAFPFALVVLAFAFLVLVAVDTRRRGLRPWKNSGIAAFAHGLDERSRELLMLAGDGQYEVEKIADELEVRLQNEGRGRILAGHVGGVGASISFGGVVDVPTGIYRYEYGSYILVLYLFWPFRLSPITSILYSHTRFIFLPPKKRFLIKTFDF